jgi:hypothetical protein
MKSDHQPLTLMDKVLVNLSQFFHSFSFY